MAKAADPINVFMTSADLWVHGLILGKKDALKSFRFGSGSIRG
jgi:hypothetical protein